MRQDQDPWETHHEILIILLLILLTSWDPLLKALRACFIPVTVTEMGGLSIEGSPAPLDCSCSSSALLARDLIGLEAIRPNVPPVILEVLSVCQIREIDSWSFPDTKSLLHDLIKSMIQLVTRSVWLVFSDSFHSWSFVRILHTSLLHLHVHHGQVEHHSLKLLIKISTALQPFQIWLSRFLGLIVLLLMGSQQWRLKTVAVEPGRKLAASPEKCTAEQSVDWEWEKEGRLRNKRNSLARSWQIKNGLTISQKQRVFLAKRIDIWFCFFEIIFALSFYRIQIWPSWQVCPGARG